MNNNENNIEKFLAHCKNNTTQKRDVYILSNAAVWTSIPDKNLEIATKEANLSAKDVSHFLKIHLMKKLILFETI